MKQDNGIDRQTKWTKLGITYLAYWNTVNFDMLSRAWGFFFILEKSKCTLGHITAKSSQEINRISEVNFLWVVMAKTFDWKKKFRFYMYS